MYECTHTQILPLLVSSPTNSYTQFYLHSLGCEFFAETNYRLIPWKIVSASCHPAHSFLFFFFCSETMNLNLTFIL